MRITTRGRYALRASMALARLQKNGSPIPVNQLADEEHISSIFLEQIFFKLRKVGIVNSVRGPGGGFQFARPPDQITLLEILEAAGEDINIAGYDQDGGERGTSSHSVWEEITALLKDYFGKMTLTMVLEREGEFVKTKNAPDPAD